MWLHLLCFGKHIFTKYLPYRGGVEGGTRMGRMGVGMVGGGGVGVAVLCSSQ